MNRSLAFSSGFDIRYLSARVSSGVPFLIGMSGFVRVSMASYSYSSNASSVLGVL